MLSFADPMQLMLIRPTVTDITLRLRDRAAWKTCLALVLDQNINPTGHTSTIPAPKTGGLDEFNGC